MPQIWNYDATFLLLLSEVELLRSKRGKRFKKL